MIPIAGFCIEAAIAPPTNACAVAVITLQSSIPVLVKLQQVASYGNLKQMLPVLFEFGSISVSSFGLFLAMGFIYGTFLVWRLARAWELDEEKILDLTLLTFFGGLLGSRIYFIIDHLNFFDSFAKMVLITKYPGFSFWGAFLGGWLALYIFVKRFKMDFLSLADMAAIGFLAALIWGNFGCFLGGCGAGIRSDLFFGVNMVELVGKRFPVQALEGLILIVLLFQIWPRAVRFHPAGKIVSTLLIYIGLVKFLTDFLRQNSSGIFYPLILSLLGIAISYRTSKRNLLADLKNIPQNTIKFLTEKDSRKMVLQSLGQNWYNLFSVNLRNKKIVWSIKLQKFGRLLRRFRVSTHPKDGR